MITKHENPAQVAQRELLQTHLVVYLRSQLRGLEIFNTVEIAEVGTAAVGLCAVVAKFLHGSERAPRVSADSGGGSGSGRADRVMMHACPDNIASLPHLDVDAVDEHVDSKDVLPQSQALGPKVELRRVAPASITLVNKRRYEEGLVNTRYHSPAVAYDGGSSKQNNARSGRPTESSHCELR
jgi:hypothetical protein